MTDTELKQYYANLLILQYRGKPNAYATIEALVEPMIMNQVPLAVQDAFNLDTAVGVQLDILGKYVGAVRRNNTFTSTVTLSDDDFRLLIKLRIAQNNAGSSLADIQNLLQFFFPNALKVYDYADMRLSYLFDSAVGSMDLAEIFVTSGSLPKPMGVQLSGLLYVPSLVGFFGFRTYDAVAFEVNGFNTYALYHMDRPWLTYADAVVP